jgi:hypothetical protein
VGKRGWSKKKWDREGGREGGSKEKRLSTKRQKAETDIEKKVGRQRQRRRLRETENKYKRIHTNFDNSSVSSQSSFLMILLSGCSPQI